MTRPSLPAGTTVARRHRTRRPARRLRRLTRTTVTSTTATYAAVAIAIPTTSGAATVTSGAVGAPGAVYRVNAPSTKQINPPTASSPWLVTVNSSRNRTDGQPDQQQTGDVERQAPKPMNARISAIAPRMPVTKFGLWSSNSNP